MNFERGIDPKKSIGLGKKSIRFFNQLNKNAVENKLIKLYKWPLNEISKKDLDLIKNYTIPRTEIQEIVAIWSTPEGHQKFILFDEDYRGNIFTWIMVIQSSPHISYINIHRYEAEVFLDDEKWWDVLIF